MDNGGIILCKVLFVERFGSIRQLKPASIANKHSTTIWLQMVSDADRCQQIKNNLHCERSNDVGIQIHCKVSSAGIAKPFRSLRDYMNSCIVTLPDARATCWKWQRFVRCVLLFSLHHRHIWVNMNHFSSSEAINHRLDKFDRSFTMRHTHFVGF